MILLKNCKYVYDSNTILKNKDIIIEDNKIKSISKSENKNTSQEKKDFEKIYDCSNKAIFPSLFNMHTHAGMSFLRSYNDNDGFHSWLSSVLKAEEKIDNKIIKYSSYLSIKEMQKTGTAGIFDMYYKPNITKKVCEDLNFYGVLSSSKQNIKESNFVKEARLAHAIYTTDEKDIIEQHNIAKERNELFHIHISETRKELYDCYNKHKKYPVEYLDSINVLNKNTIGAHLGWVKLDEIKTLAKKDVLSVTCPISNMKLSTGGTLQYQEFQKEGAKVAIGTDGASSNNSQNLIEEMKMFSLIQKHQYWDSKVANAKETINLGLNGWDKINEFYSTKGGKIKENFDANIFAIDLNRSEMIPTNEDNILSNFVYSNKNVDFHLINGKEVYNFENELSERLDPKLMRAKKYIEEFNSQL